MEYPPLGGYSVSMTKLSVHIIPNASSSHVVGKEGNAWKIRISAPPIEGRANEAIIELLSEILDIPKTSISLMRGGSSKIKLLDVPLPSGFIEELLAAATK